MKRLSFVIMLMLMLVGCKDGVSIEDRDFVVGMSIDKSGEEYMVNFAMPVLNKDSEDNQSGSIIKKASGKNVAEAFENINQVTSGSVYFGHTKVCIIGKEILKDKNAFKSVLDTLEKNSEVSRRIILLASDNGEEILSFGAENEASVEFIDEYYKNNINTSGVTVKGNFAGVMQDLLAVGNTLLPYIHIEDEALNIGGSVIMRDYEYIRDLSEEETRGLLWICNRNVSGVLAVGENAIRIKDKKVIYSVVNGKTSVRVDIKGELAEGKTKNIADINAQTEDFILKEVENSLSIIQKHNVDVIGLSETMRKNYNYNLGDKFGSTNIDIDINADISTKENIK